MENKNDRFIYNIHATHSSMEQILQGARETEQVGLICKHYGLNQSLLGSFFKLKSKGLNNLEASKKLRVHRVTAQRYALALKKMDDSEFNFIYDYILRGENDTKNNIKIR